MKLKILAEGTSSLTLKLAETVDDSAACIRLISDGCCIFASSDRTASS